MPEGLSRALTKRGLTMDDDAVPNQVEVIHYDRTGTFEILEANLLEAALSSGGVAGYNVFCNGNPFQHSPPGPNIVCIPVGSTNQNTVCSGNGDPGGQPWNTPTGYNTVCVEQWSGSSSNTLCPGNLACYSNVRC